MRITESQLRRIVKRIVEDSTFIQPGQHAQELGLKVPEEDIDILQSAIDSGAYNGEEFNVDAYPELGQHPSSRAEKIYAHYLMIPTMMNGLVVAQRPPNVTSSDLIP